MLNIIFNIVGILFIGYGIFILRTNNKNKVSSASNPVDMNDIKNFKEVLEEKTTKEERKKEEKMVESNIYTANVLRTNKPSDIEKTADEDKAENLVDESHIKTEYKPKSIIIDTKSKPNLPTKEKSFKDEVLSLHKLGITSGEIAKKTGKSVREIEIILKVNKSI